MTFDTNKALEKLHVIGISYTLATIEIREKFSLQETALASLLEEAKSLAIEGLVVLSTCNRTELFAYTSNHDLLKRLLIKHSKGTSQELESFGYHHTCKEAVEHIFRVGVGLDSQILGDFQIIGQLKDAYRRSDEKELAAPVINRLFSSVFAASKKVKNETELSNGAASVAHAAVQYIKDNCPDLGNANILLFGTGEIGKITCSNLVKHSKNRSLTLINRTLERAQSLASKYDVTYKDIDSLEESVSNSNVIIVATGANRPTLLPEHIANNQEQKLILDLSVPRNVSPELKEYSNLSIVTVDELSQVSDEIIKIREQSIPKAQSLIETAAAEFFEWMEIQHLSPIFKAVKSGLENLKNQELDYHKNKLSSSEYEKANLIASNIVNRIARMSITHIKDSYKSEKSSIEVVERLFNHPHKK